MNPSDVRPEMMALIRRIQSKIRDNAIDGVAVVTVRIVFDGVTPVSYLEPEVTKIEPKSRREMLLALFGEVSAAPAEPPALSQTGGTDETETDDNRPGAKS